jgi:hypothetical protein
MDLMLLDKCPFNSIKLMYDFGIIQLLYKFPENCEGINNTLKYSKVFIELKNEDLVSKLILQSVKLS